MSLAPELGRVAVDRRTVICIALLLACGGLWGAIPMLSKIASEQDSHAIGLSFLVNMFGVVAAGLICLMRGKLRWPTHSESRFFFCWAILYSVFNQVLIYWLSAHLDAAVVSAFTVLEGLMIFAAAGCIGLEKPSALRCSGLFVGLLGALLLVVSPSLSAGMARPALSPFFMFAAILVPVSYAAESLYMAAKRPPAVDPIFAILGVMVFSLPILFVLAFATNDFVPLQFPPGRTELAALCIMAATLLANILYFKLIAMAGSVFAGQLSYFNALFGIAWGVFVLGEGWPMSMMAAFVLMLLGLLIVRPHIAHATTTPRCLE